MTPTQGALIGFALLLALLAGSMPVGFVMAGVGLVGFALMVSPQAAISMATTDLYSTFSDYNLTTIPLFVLMGQLAFHTGISRGLFHAAYHLGGPAARRPGDGDGRRVHGVRGDLLPVQTESPAPPAGTGLHPGRESCVTQRRLGDAHVVCLGHGRDVRRFLHRHGSGGHWGGGHAGHRLVQAGPDVEETASMSERVHPHLVHGDDHCGGRNHH